MHEFKEILKPIQLPWMFLLSISLAFITTPTNLHGFSGAWISNGPEGGRIKALAIDPSSPQTIYAGTSGGVFKSTNGGNNWIAANTGFTQNSVSALAIDPASTQTLYAGIDGLNNYIYKTTNGGNSWKAIHTGFTAIMVSALVIDPVSPQTVYAASIMGPVFVFKTTDSGNSWIAVGNDVFKGSVYALAIDPASPRTIYAGTFNGVLKSTDGGISWTEVNTGISTGAVEAENPGLVVKSSMPISVNALAIDPVSPQTVYVSTSPGVFKTTDGGNNWTPINRIKSTEGMKDPFMLNRLFGVMALAIDPTNPRTIYAGTNFGVSKSVDGGSSWTAVKAHLNPNSSVTPTPVFALAIDPTAPQTVYAGRDDGVQKSTDSGNNWTAANTGLVATVINALAIDPTAPKTLYAGTISGRIFKTRDGGENWIDPGSTGLPLGYFYAFAIDPKSPQTLYATAGEVFKTIDGGSSWVAVSRDRIRGIVNTLAIDPVSPQTVYAGTQKVLYKTMDGGKNWTATNTGINIGEIEAEYRNPDGKLPIDLYIHTLAINPKSPLIVYAGLRMNHRPGNVSDIPQNVLSGNVDSWILKSKDGGNSWQTIKIEMSGTIVNALAIDPASPRTVYAAASKDGAYKSTDGGNNWTAIGSDLTDANVQSLAIDPSSPGTVYAGTLEGLFRTTDGGRNWNIIDTGLPSPGISALTIDPSSPQRIYIGTSCCGVLAGTDDVDD